MNRHTPPLPNDPLARGVAAQNEVLRRITQIEQAKDPRPYTSGFISGLMTINTKTATRLTGSNELINIPPGTYLFGMSVFMQQQAEGLNGMNTALCRSDTGAGMFVNPFCYSVGRNTFDGGYFTSVFRGTIAEPISFVPYCWCDVSTNFGNVEMWATPCN